MADKKLTELTKHNPILGSDSRLYSVIDPSTNPLYGYTEYEDLRDQISAYIGDAGNPLDNLICVAKNGNDTTGIGSSGKPYLTITKALSTINSAGQTVTVAPGTYNEAITFTYDDTTIFGQSGSGGQQSVIITQANANIVDFGTTSRCIITTCNIQLTAAASSIYAIKQGASGYGRIRFSRVDVTCVAGGILAGIGYTDGGRLDFTHGKLFYTNNVVGAGTEVKSAFRVNTGATLKLYQQKDIVVNTSGASDYTVLISDGGTSGKIIMEGCTEVSIDDGDANYTGMVYLTGTNLLHEFKYNEILINENTTNSGIGCAIYNPSGIVEIRSFFNHINIGQLTGTTYSFTVATGGTLTSHFDDIVSGNGASVAPGGTYNYVNSPHDGDIQISGSYLNMYDSALTVGVRGADYTSIQNAIDSITDAASNKQYIIIIYPGTYIENIDFTGKPFIHLVGIDRVNTSITSSSGVTLKLCDKTTGITNLKISSTGGSIIEVPSGATGSKYRFRNCSIREIINNTFADAIEIKSGLVEFNNCNLHYVQTGTGGGTHRMINITGSADVIFGRTNIIMEVAIVSDDVIGIEESNNVISFNFSSSKFEIDRSGIVTGETIIYLANGTSSDKVFFGNYLRIDNGGSGGNATVCKTSGNTCIVYGHSNTVIVRGFTNNWSFNISATDTVYPSFDIITAAQGYTGAGTINYMYATDTGDFYVKRDILLDRNIKIGGTLKLSVGTTVNEISTTFDSVNPSDDVLVTEKAIDTFIDTSLNDYIKKDGSVAFIGVVGGITPTLNAHLATKGYVDAIAAEGGAASNIGPFVDKDLITSPDSPTIGDKYIIAGTGGYWAGGSINDVAECTDSTSWTFVTPTAGKNGWVIDEAIEYTFNGTSWQPTGSTISHLSLQDIGLNSHVQIDSHISNITTNPHIVTKTNVGLGNVTDDAQLKRAANDFNGFGAKVIPADNDRVLIEDSADGLAKKYILTSNMHDMKVKVSSNDTTQDYLVAKLIGTPNKITVTEIGDGGNEDLQIGYGSELTTLTDGSDASALHTHTMNSEFQETSDDTESNTTSTTFQQKLRMTTTNLPAGSYRIAFYCETWQSGVSVQVESKVELNDTTTLATHLKEPKDVNDRFSNGGFVYQTLSGINNIDIDYRRQSGGTAYIRRARIELWRVS